MCGMKLKSIMKKLIKFYREEERNKWKIEEEER